MYLEHTEQHLTHGLHCINVSYQMFLMGVAQCLTYGNFSTKDSYLYAAKYLPKRLYKINSHQQAECKIVHFISSSLKTSTVKKVLQVL